MPGRCSKEPVAVTAANGSARSVTVHKVTTGCFSPGCTLRREGQRYGRNIDVKFCALSTDLVHLLDYEVTMPISVTLGTDSVSVQ